MNIGVPHIGGKILMYLVLDTKNLVDICLAFRSLNRELKKFIHFIITSPKLLGKKLNDLENPCTYTRVACAPQWRLLYEYLSEGWPRNCFFT